MAKGNPIGWKIGAWDDGAWAQPAWGFSATAAATSTGTAYIEDTSLPMSYKLGYGAGLSIVTALGRAILGG